MVRGWISSNNRKRKEINFVKDVSLALVCKAFLILFKMNLIRWKDSEIQISPEAYGIKVFRNIWNADRSKYKEKAISMLTTLFFLYDPRSEYQYIVDIEERLDRIKEDTGLDKNWKPDKLFNEAIPVYIKLTETTSSRMLETNRLVVDKLTAYLKEMEVGEEDDKGKLKNPLSSIVRTIQDCTKLSLDISIAERKIHDEIEEKSIKMRGDGDKTIGDDGFNFMDE